ncbi:MAG: macro domain-containing protein [Chloroflexota bacterium]|nr:macro domain-containing protein [Chloroflexota bacterium]
MSDDSLAQPQRFGRTGVFPVAGEPLSQQVEALVCAANRRGLMGTGHAGAIRLAGGATIERLAMAHAPLTLGTALLTSPGLLADRGVRAIIHAVVNDELAAPTRLDTVRRAIQAILVIADEQRFRSIAIPVLGSGTAPDRLTADIAASVLVEEVVGHLRRSPGRIERIYLIGRDEDESRLVTNLLAENRDRSWPVTRQ